MNNKDINQSNRLIIGVVSARKFAHCLKSIPGGPGSIPGLGVICRLSLSLVLVFAPRGFYPGTLVFPSPRKTNTCKFQFGFGKCLQ